MSASPALFVDSSLDPPDELVNNRADPDDRAVLEDWYLDRGIRVTRLGCALFFIHAYDAAAAYAAAANNTDADAADAADDAAAAAYDDAAAAAVVALSTLLLGEIDMHDGLKLIQLPGRYGYSVTRVGWMRRVGGDEWELLPGAVSIGRTSGQRTIDQVAIDGPGKDHQLWPPSKGVEEIHRLVIRRSMPADEKAWAKHCPKPKDWASP